MIKHFRTLPPGALLGVLAAGAVMLTVTLVMSALGRPMPNVPAISSERSACYVLTRGPVHTYNGPAESYQISGRVPGATQLFAVVRTNDGWFQVIWSDKAGWIAASDILELRGNCGLLPLPTATPLLLAQADISPGVCLAHPSGSIAALRSGPDPSYPVTVTITSGALAVVEGRTDTRWLLLRYEDQGNIFQGYAAPTEVRLEGGCEWLRLIPVDQFTPMNSAGRQTDVPEACTVTFDQPFVVFAEADAGAEVLMVLSAGALLPVADLPVSKTAEWVQVTLVDGTPAYVKGAGAIFSGACE